MNTSGRIVGRSLLAVVLSTTLLAACGDSAPAGSHANKDGAAGTEASGQAGSTGAAGEAGLAGMGAAGTGVAGSSAGGSGGAAGATDAGLDVAGLDAAGDAVDGSNDAVDAPSDVPPPVPATTIPATAIDFGVVACGSSGGGLPLSFTNTGTAPLHYRALIMPGGIYALMGAAADGSVSGDVAPGGMAMLTIVAGTIGTTTASGATFPGSLAIVTNASGAENVHVALKMLAQGATCTLVCGSFAKCTPASGAPYCANTDTDNGNCGACGHVCGAGQVCTAGNCALTCGAITTCMPTGVTPYCANTQTDGADCGTCGHSCATGETCMSGACVLTCGALTKCTPSAAAPYCANTGIDGANCGTCGHVCGTGEICTGGACVLSCGALTKCTPSVGAPYCANTNTDNGNCGTCGNPCAAGQVCSGGTCTLTCGSLTKCTPGTGDPYCANTKTDNLDCGACGHACTAGQACIMGTCTNTCSTSQTLCDGACTSTAYDPNNCGACDHVCAFAHAAASCATGTCALASCAAGFADCDRDPSTGCEVNKNTDAANCGACGFACALGETCGGGTCSADLSQGLLGYWALNDAVGSATAADSSGHHLDGQVQGNLTFVPGAGKQGSGAAMFGGSAFIRAVFPNDAAGSGTGLFLPQGNITFAMWFKTTSANVGGLQVVEGPQTHAGCDRVIGNGSGGTLSFNTWGEVNITEPFVVNDGVWHQVVYVLDKTSGFKAYVDGVLEISTATPTGNCGVGCSGFDWAEEYWIGRGASCRFGADYFTGLIDDVRIYDHALPPTTVTQLFNATK